MSSASKLVAGMCQNQLDWRIEDLKVVARHYGIHFRQPGTSHVTFRHSGVGLLTVPAARPVKPYYIRQFLAMIDRIEESDA